MNLANWLKRQAEINPTRPALFLGVDCVADYATFWTQARAVAAALKARGVRPGDRVAIFMKNCPDYLIVFYGVWCLGAAVVPINAKLHGREARYIIENARVNMVFATPQESEALIGAEIRSSSCIQVPSVEYDAMCSHEPIADIVPRAPDDLAWLFYTSGTTGKPKGVMITHRMLMTMSLCYVVDADPVSEDDATLYAAPMSHGAGIYNMLHVRAGARHVCPPSGGFDPMEIFDLAEHFGAVQLFAAPTMVTRMTQTAIKHGRTGAGLRTVVYAGGPMYNADIIAAVDHFGPIFVQIYGQGECPMGITVLTRGDVNERQSDGWQARLQSVGRAQSAVEVAIGDGQGNPLPTGQHGEIIVRGDTIMPGYWQNTEATEKTIVNGWLMTGDMGFMDAAGYVTMQDRSKDLIISGGSNVYPREVEEVLLLDPGVEEVSVVGRVHPDWGEEVVAFIVGKFDREALDRLCLDHIARFKRPKEYIGIESLPKNNYGKVLKTELRALLASSQDK